MSRTTTTEADLKVIQDRIATKNKVNLQVSARAKTPSLPPVMPIQMDGVVMVPIKPMSVNEAWRGKRFKSIAYLKYQERVLAMLPPKLIGKHKLKISFEFGFSSKASDIDNPVKQVMDILSKKYGYNDNMIYEMHLKKFIVDKGKECFSFKIESL